MVAITLRKLAELELAAAAAEEAAAAAGGSGGAADAAPAAGGGGKGGGATPAPPLSLKERERQQAVAIAEEALSIAQQAYGESLDWQRKQGQPESGGLLSWLRPKPSLNVLRRPQRPDSAALEVAHCLHTLSHAHSAVAQPAAAANDLEAALKLLDDAFPEAAAARAARVDEPPEQRQDQQEVSAAAPQAAGSGGSGGSGSGDDEEEDQGSGSGSDADVNARAAVSLAAAVSAKEAARAQRVEAARKQLACGMLAELLVLAAGGEADLEAVEERWAQEGCAAS